MTRVGMQGEGRPSSPLWPFNPLHNRHALKCPWDMVPDKRCLGCAWRAAVGCLAHTPCSLGVSGCNPPPGRGADSTSPAHEGHHQHKHILKPHCMGLSYTSSGGCVRLREGCLYTWGACPQLGLQAMGSYPAPSVNWHLMERPCVLPL